MTSALHRHPQLDFPFLFSFCFSFQQLAVEEDGFKSGRRDFRIQHLKRGPLPPVGVPAANSRQDRPAEAGCSEAGRSPFPPSDEGGPADASIVTSGKAGPEPPVRQECLSFSAATFGVVFSAATDSFRVGVQEDPLRTWRDKQAWYFPGQLPSCPAREWPLSQE